jgi:hypothetical protein
MLRHSKKLCINGDGRYIYAHKRCLSCYKREILYPKQKAKQKLSDKKVSLNKQYDEKRKIFIEELKLSDKNGKLYCIFCGKVITEEPSLHHGLGRDDDVMLDDRFWFVSHNYCHVSQYHSISCFDISWWNGYIDRLKTLLPSVSEILLKLEYNRMNKALYEQEKRNTNTDNI